MLRQEVGSLNVRVITSFALNLEVIVGIDGTKALMQVEKHPELILLDVTGAQYAAHFIKLTGSIEQLF